MKLHLTQAEGQNLITAYEDGSVSINRQRYTNSLIVMPELLINDWTSSENKTLTFDTLTTADFEKIAALKPEVLLLGTGKTHRFLHPRLSAGLSEQGIALECMTTAAACRTYNILMSEGRNVAAALLL
ncbi:MAG TPA: Mth938-like domain-containing protein [Methylotenera sp.]|nr:Mth938-like domain-containing protein [Methylotenera sp.]